MQDDYLGHHKLGATWNLSFKDEKRSAKVFENCFLTIMYFDQEYSFVNHILARGGAYLPYTLQI